MGTNVHLTPELEQFARDRVRAGRYNNVSEVVRDVLRLLQDQEALRRSAEAARVEDERRTAAAVACRKAAFQALRQRWSTTPSIMIGPWARDELYD